MKLHNSNIREILEQSGKPSAPLTRGEVDAQYQLLLNRIQPQPVPVKTSKYFYKNIISQYIMITSKQMVAAALTLVIGAGTLAVGYDRALAYNLSSEIKNAPNAAEYEIEMDFTDVLLNGKVVSKDHVAKTLGNQENVSMIGGITGYTGPEEPKAPIVDGKIAEPLPEGASVETVAMNASDPVVIATPEDAARELGISLEEAKRLEAEALKNPYGPGFETATKFLELKGEKKVTYIGVDAEGAIAFYATVTN